jgi:hypothetical protein
MRCDTLKRVLVRVCAFLLLGAIVNVAVAWLYVVFIPFASSSAAPQSAASQGMARRATDADRAWWNAHKPLDFANDPQVASSFHFFGVDSKLLTADRATDMEFHFDDKGFLKMWKRKMYKRTPFAFDYALTVEAGWPLPSLRGTRWAFDAYGGQMHIAAVARWQTTADETHRYSIPWHRGPVRFILPCEPMLGGFAVNTVCYAALAWLLVSLATMLRRRRRIKRGLCPKCAYPVGPSEVCTECGKPVGAKAVAA